MRRDLMVWRKGEDMFAFAFVSVLLKGLMFE